MKKLKIILAAALVLTGLNAPAQVFKGLTRQTGFTNLVCPSSVTSGAVSNLTSQPLFIQPGYGVAVQATATGLASTNVNTQGVFLSPSVDGTNFLTVCPFALTWNLNGVTATIAGTNIPAASLDGYAAIRVAYYTNGTLATVSGVSIKLSRIRPIAP